MITWQSVNICSILITEQAVYKSYVHKLLCLGVQQTQECIQELETIIWGLLPWQQEHFTRLKRFWMSLFNNLVTQSTDIHKLCTYVCVYPTVVLSESLGSTPATHTQAACRRGEIPGLDIMYLGREIVTFWPLPSTSQPVLLYNHWNEPAMGLCPKTQW